MTVKERINTVINDVVTLSDLDINGDDLIELGYSGINIKRALAFLIDSVLSGKVQNEKNALIKELSKFK